MNKPVYDGGKVMVWGLEYHIIEHHYSERMGDYLYVLENTHVEEHYELLSEKDLVRLVGNPDSEYNILKKETLEELAEAYDNVCKDYRDVKNIALKLYDREPLTKEEKETLHFLLFMRRVAKEDDSNGKA